MVFCCMASAVCTGPCNAKDIGTTYEGLNEIHCQAKSVTGLERIGSGGGGTVFSGIIDGIGSKGVAKISWDGSKASVENECRVLKHLEKYNIDHIEKCLAVCDGSSSKLPSSRSVAILTPLYTDQAVSTLRALGESKLPNRGNAMRRACNALISTTVRMIHAGVALSDVQLLIDPSQGDLLLIDMTEGKLFDSPTPSSLDLQLARSFLSESLIFAQEAVDSGEMSQSELEGIVKREILSVNQGDQGEDRSSSKDRDRDSLLLQFLQDYLQ